MVPNATEADTSAEAIDSHPKKSTSTHLNFSSHCQIQMAAPAPAMEKCAFRSCKVTGAELLQCAAPECNKKIHFMCYQGLVLKKHPDLQGLPSGKASCTKKCHVKALKEAAGGGDAADGGGRKGNWDCDGKNGPDDPKTSVRILLDWWTTEGNYSKLRRFGNSRITES